MRDRQCAAMGRAGWRAGLHVLVVVMALALTGCAAQLASREGKALLAEGKPREGIAKLEEASRLDPGSAEHRIGYLQARDGYAQALIERGDAARAQGQYDEAETSYREALSVRGQQDRASAGLRLIERQRRWDAAVGDAQQLIAKKEWDAAREKLQSVLSESPREASALTLMQQISQQQSRKPAAPTALAMAYKQPVSLEFKDVPLKTVFEVIARTSGLNFLFDKDVRTDQRTSIYLRNSTVEAAVNWLLLTNQLEQRVLDGSTVLVYPANPAKQLEYKPLLVKSFYLANADAKVVAATLKALLKSRDVVVDEKLNLVILRDSPEAIRLAEKIVTLHDVPEAEVMLEVEVLEVKRDRLLDLGIAWPSQVGLSVLPSAAGGVLTVHDLRHSTWSDVGVNVGPVTINAQKQDGDTNLLANPRIRARNHEKAKILIGDRVPNVTTTLTANGFASESVTYLDVGLKIEVEPTVYLDNEVAIKIALEVSSITSQQTTKNGSLIYQIGTRNAQTVLRLKDGENQVLAGLINSEDRSSANKVPGLGEFPIVGRLFGEQTDKTSKTEIVLSITPRILRNVQRPDADILEFESGTDSNLRTWPAMANAGTVAGSEGASAGRPSNSAAANTNAPGAPSIAAGTPPVMVAIPVPVVANAAPAVPEKPAQPMPKLQWIAPPQVKAGDTFTAQLNVQTDVPLFSAPMVLEFDPKMLQVVSVTEGTFLKDGGVATTFKPRIEPSGQVFITASRDAAATSGASAPGTIATLVMKVLPTAAANSTQVQVLRFAPKVAGGQDLLVPPPAPLAVRVTR